MGSRRCVLIFLVLLFWSYPLLAAERSVHLATLDWEPYIGKRLEAFGFGGEIIREAFERAGYEVTFSFMPWVRALRDVEQGRYDAVCFAYRSEERAQKYLFSEAYAESVLGLSTYRDSGITFRSLEDLTPYRIGVVRGFVNTPEFDALPSLKKEEVKNELLNLKKLLNRRVDLIVIDKFVMQHLMKTHFPGQEKSVDFLEPPLAVHPLYLMFSRALKRSEKMTRDFNRSIRVMKADGTIEEIMKRHGYAQ